MLLREKSTTRRCPDCGAPNPQGRETCYSCGTRLDKVNPNVALPGERTFPCLNCGAPIPFRAAACGACGRVVAPQGQDESVTRSSRNSPLSAASSAFLVALPDGWSSEPLPDGTVRLFRSGWWKNLSSRFGSSLMGATCVLLWITFRLLLFTRVPFYREEVAPTASVFLYVLIGVVILVGIAFLLLREEIRIGPGRVERRRGIFGKVWLSQIDGSAVVRVQTYDGQSRYGAYRERTVRVENLGAKIVIASIRQTPMLFGGFAASLGGAYFDEPAQIGRYIADVTGWPFIDPAAGSF